MLTAATRRLDDRQVSPALVAAPLALAALICLVLAVTQFTTAMPTAPVLAVVIAAAGWVVHAVASVAPVLLVVACLLLLAAVSPWFLLGLVALAGRRR